MFVFASVGLGWGGIRCRSSFHCINLHNYSTYYMFIVTVLAQPTFNSATINEGEELSITCVTGNIRDITSFQVLDPRGMPVPTTVVGIYTLMNALRNASGVYTCIVTNTMTSATINATSTVVVQCEFCRSRILALLYNRKYCWRGLNLIAEPQIIIANILHV